MAEWLAARGHSVSVVTAPPYYPQWRVHDGYRAGRYAREERAGVSVRRAPLWVPARPGGVKRLLHLASFALSSLPSLLRAAAGRPTSSWWSSRRCSARPRHGWPPGCAALAPGCTCRTMKWTPRSSWPAQGAWLRCAVARAERWLMRRFDRVSTISERMLALARDKGVEPARAVLLPNWIDAQAITPDLDGGAYRAQLGIPADAIVALYSGNMGGKQGLQVLADVARRLEGETRLWFVFCGQGPERARCRRAAPDWRAHASWTCSPPNAWASCCAWRTSIYCRSAGAADLVMPSKLTGMLASGRPVVCGAAPGTELAGVITRCGLLTPLKTRPWPRPCSAWRKTARPGPRWARPRGAMPWLICTWTRCWARPSANWRPLPSRAGHRPRAPATPDGVRPITPKVRAASAAGPRR